MRNPFPHLRTATPPPTIMSLTPRLLRRVPRLARPHSTHSVDPSEVSHFNALAAEWWDPHGSSRLLHLMNPLRLQFLQSCLVRGHTSPPASNRILDVGCGGGILSESLARLPTTQSVIGLDPTPGVLAVAKQHMRADPALRGKLVYHNTTVDAFPRGEFDIVFRPCPRLRYTDTYRHRLQRWR